jgi:hypothetical protein
MAEIQETRQRLIVMVGLPRSGKSTWARKSGYPVVSLNGIRRAIAGPGWRNDEDFDAFSSEPVVWSHARVSLAALFYAGHRVVVRVERARSGDHPNANALIKTINDYSEMWEPLSPTEPEEIGQGIIAPLQNAAVKLNTISSKDFIDRMTAASSLVRMVLAEMGYPL